MVCAGSSMIGRLFKIMSGFKRAANGRVIDRLHGDIMAAARRPGIYLHLGVPDTFEGRFEAFSLLAILTVRRLGQLEMPGPDMAQELTNAIFRHFDAMLREMGVGDLTVPKRLHTMAEAFMGRSRAYIAAGDDAAAMAEALGRNVLGGKGDPAALLAYVNAVADMLESASMATIYSEPLRFPEPAPRDL
jgi:cytochrome b pre-mRNA-processing protein 3